MFRGRGRGGGEYTVLEVKGYPGDVVQYIGDVPPGLNRNCLEKKILLLLESLTAQRGVCPDNSTFTLITVQSLPFHW